VNKEKHSAETEDTAGQQGAAATPPNPEEKVEAGKVDVERLLTDDAYLEKVIGTEPSKAVEGETSAQGGEGTAKEGEKQGEAKKDEAPPPKAEEDPVAYTLGGVYGKEEVRQSDALNRLEGPRHLKKIVEQIAPYRKIINSNPIFAQALEEAAAGKPERMNRALAALTGTLAEEPEPRPSRNEARIAEAVKQLKRKPEFKDYPDEDLETMAAAAVALNQAPAATGTTDTGAERELTLEEHEELRDAKVRTETLQATLAAMHPPETVKAVKAQIQEFRQGLDRALQNGEINQRQYDTTIWLYNDPRAKDDAGNPFYLTLWQEALAEVTRSKAGGSGAPAAAAPKPAPVELGGRLEAGAGGADFGSSGSADGLPNLQGKNLTERQAAINRFLQQ
jgi:hypothetical protein